MVIPLALADVGRVDEGLGAGFHDKWYGFLLLGALSLLIYIVSPF